MKPGTGGQGGNPGFVGVFGLVLMGVALLGCLHGEGNSRERPLGRGACALLEVGEIGDVGDFSHTRTAVSRWWVLPPQMDHFASKAYFLDVTVRGEFLCTGSEMHLWEGL